MTDLTPLERERMATIFLDDITGETYEHYLFYDCTTASVPYAPSLETSYGEYYSRYTPWVSRQSPMQHLVKRRSWEKGEAMERCQEPAQGQNTNDDDEIISFISSQLRTAGQLLVYCNKPHYRSTSVLTRYAHEYNTHQKKIRIRFALN